MKLNVTSESETVLDGEECSEDEWTKPKSEKIKTFIGHKYIIYTLQLQLRLTYIG